MIVDGIKNIEDINLLTKLQLEKAQLKKELEAAHILIEANAKEIGSYSRNTGLRGENAQLRVDLDNLEYTLELYRDRCEELEGNYK